MSADAAPQPPPPDTFFFTVQFPFVAGLGLDVLCHNLGLFKGSSAAQRKVSASTGFFLAAVEFFPVQLHLGGKVHALTLQMVEQMNG